MSQLCSVEHVPHTSAATPQTLLYGDTNRNPHLQGDVERPSDSFVSGTAPAEAVLS